MNNRSEFARDIVAGCVLVCIGLAAIWKAQASLQFGALASMGPGFFPIMLGLCVGVCGLALVVITMLSPNKRATASDEESPTISARAVGFLILAVGVFALTVKTLGLVPAAFLLVAISASADRRTKPLKALALAAALSVTSWLIFIAGLAMPLAAFSF